MLKIADFFKSLCINIFIRWITLHLEEFQSAAIGKKLDMGKTSTSVLFPSVLCVNS